MSDELVVSESVATRVGASHSLTLSRAWTIYLGFTVASIVAYFLIPSTEIKNIVYLCIGGSGVAAMVAGVRINPSIARPWLFVAGGQFLMLTGDVIWNVYENVNHTEAPFPWIPDILYLSGYPFMLAGLAILIRRRWPGRDLPSLIDASIIATAVGVVVWVLYMSPLAGDPSLSFPEVAVSLAYPVLDIGLLAMVVWMIVAPGVRNVSFWLLAGGIGGLLLADVGFAVATVRGSYHTGHPADAGWLVCYVLLGAAVLHPAARDVVVTSETPSLGLSRTRLAFLAIAALLAPGVLAFEAMRGEPLQAPVIAGASTTLFLLVVTRMAIMLREVEGQASVLHDQGRTLRKALEERQTLEEQLRHLAFHDSLTQLPNRALFADRLDSALERSRRAKDLVAMMLVDLDHFKLVNDGLGHAAGDDLLRELSLRLRRSMRATDTAARLGGDEFAILLEQFHDEAEVRAVADRLVAELAHPVLMGDVEVSIHASIGIAIEMATDVDADALMHRADVAMYKAKKHEDLAYVVYEDGMKGYDGKAIPGVVRRSPGSSS